MYRGRERDGLFISEDAINAYEFTMDTRKAKAEKDAEKLREILEDLHNEPNHRYKAPTGWFVTRHEPTAEQRTTVQRVSKQSGINIHAISISTLQNRLCNSDEYLRCRDAATFGSTSYSSEVAQVSESVKVEFEGTGTRLSNEELSKQLIAGKRALIVGDFGVGKSHALREIYRLIRKEHFRRKRLTPFPVHINLRDCIGLKSPAEILRRHSEDIGFGNDRSLISAWRAGACVLLLDGFDEIVPTRWMGSAGDLKNVRWEALAPIRRLVEETPHGTGIAVCGRAHYFSSKSEMMDTLGFNSMSEILTLHDFSQEQITQYLRAAGVRADIPEWIPGRPLLIGYLVSSQSLIPEDGAEIAGEAESWRLFFTSICEREARMFTAVRPAVIKSILARVATLVREQSTATGPIGMPLMEEAFVAVNNRRPDEEGIQLLLRLPGLATVEGTTGSANEERYFVDANLAETAYGEDLAEYISNYYNDHPLKRVSSWLYSAGRLGTEVAALALEERRIPLKQVLQTADQRQNEGQFDAVLCDILQCASKLDDSASPNSRKTYTIEGVAIEHLEANSDAISGNIIYKDCLIQHFDISAAEEGSTFSHFQSCIFGYIEGAASLPSWVVENFQDCTFEEFSNTSSTTAGILQLDINPRLRVALTILKKIYAQRGSGRKAGALRRGLDQASQLLVPEVLSALQTDGLVTRSSSSRNIVYLPVKSRRGEVLKALEKPGDFRLNP
ncbi:hypothetical protein AIIKEEIJ_03091 [Rhodococcus sp. YH1]|nr:hypothetical protein [Rhodococcus sp. YH1]